MPRGGKSGFLQVRSLPQTVAPSLVGFPTAVPVPHATCLQLAAGHRACGERTQLSCRAWLCQRSGEGGTGESPRPHPPDQELTLPVGCGSAQDGGGFFGCNCSVFLPVLSSLELNVCLSKTPSRCLEAFPVLCPLLISSGGAASHHPFHFQGILTQRCLRPPLVLGF